MKKIGIEIILNNKINLKFQTYSSYTNDIAEMFAKLNKIYKAKR